MDYLLTLDSVYTRLAAAFIPHVPFARAAFSFFSFTGGTLVIWLLPATLLVVYEEYKRHDFLMYFLAATALSSALVNIVLKEVFIRIRPYVVWRIAAPVCPTDYSFPSGHAAVSFAAAAVLSAFDRKRRGWYYAVAAIVSYSRVFLYCHYLGDVLIGAIIGYAIGKSLLFLRRCYKKGPGLAAGQKREKA